MTTTSQKQFDALSSIIDKGLPECYTDINEYFIDYWMDFSWNKEMKVEVQSVLDHPQFMMLNTAINAAYNFDVQAELIKGRDSDETPYYA